MKLLSPLLKLSFASFVLFFGATVPALAADTQQPLQTIQALDVPRYMGTWFEIAKYPNRFQKQCVANTSAEYSLQQNGSVKVLNRCRLASGELELAEGQARQIGAANSPKLEVRFAPAWLSWLPMVWGNYWVIDLDPEYQLVAVSEPKREFLWVLARTQQVDKAKYDALLQRLKAKGFDLNRLELSPQGN
ncbi:MAG: lipocalin family protein [Burkholderiales bacterium]|jgi:apolipoprotein D and lipocalin family protein|uniref:lipocalin family protein n=1 Tax=Limnobacter sp. TaxID=2003368 RepID=UPI0039239751|nr:lipocalin family protein [Burkholderiales bacterium]